MAKFIYSGPVDTIEIRDGARVEAGVTVPEWRDVPLVPGQTVELPDNNALVAGMIAAGHLKAAANAPAKTNTGKPSKASGSAEEENN